MKLAGCEIPDENLLAEGQNRTRWLTLNRDYGPKLVLPLRSSTVLSLSVLEKEIPNYIPSLPVAVYKRRRQRGKWWDYDYIGDEYW